MPPTMGAKLSRDTWHCFFSPICSYIASFFAPLFISRRNWTRFFFDTQRHSIAVCQEGGKARLERDPLPLKWENRCNTIRRHMPFATCLPNTCSVESARGILYFAKGTFFLYRRQSQTKRKKNKLNCFLVLAPCMCIDQHNSLVGTKPPAREMGQDMVLLPSKLVFFFRHSRGKITFLHDKHRSGSS